MLRPLLSVGPYSEGGPDSFELESSEEEEGLLPAKRAKVARRPADWGLETVRIMRISVGLTSFP